MNFPRVDRLPEYVFTQVIALKIKAQAAGEDIVDFGMGNPDGLPPAHIVKKLDEEVKKPGNHRWLGNSPTQGHDVRVGAHAGEVSTNGFFGVFKISFSRGQSRRLTGHRLRTFWRGLRSICADCE
jgi:hypothetical protein